MRIPRGAFGGLPEHGRVLESAVSLLAADTRVEALYLSGSLAAGTPDPWSDIDLWIVVQGGDIEEVINAHRSLIGQVAPIGTLFPATHLGNPHQIIVFYKEAYPVHVDYQYTEARELVPRRRDAEVVILLDRTGR
jgi:predicted nucleotidyltransferase